MPDTTAVNVANTCPSDNAIDSPDPGSIPMYPAPKPIATNVINETSNDHLNHVAAVFLRRWGCDTKCDLDAYGDWYGDGYGDGYGSGAVEEASASGTSSARPDGRGMIGSPRSNCGLPGSGSP